MDPSVEFLRSTTPPVIKLGPMPHPWASIPWWGMKQKSSLLPF